MQTHRYCVNTYFVYIVTKLAKNPLIKIGVCIEYTYTFFAASHHTNRITLCSEKRESGKFFTFVHVSRNIIICEHRNRTEIQVAVRCKNWNGEAIGTIGQSINRPKYTKLLPFITSVAHSSQPCWCSKMSSTIIFFFEWRFGFASNRCLAFVSRQQQIQQ